MKIFFEEDTMRMSISGAITSSIYLKIGGRAFPAKGWSDFVIIILDWWLEAYKNIACGSQKEADFSFMDGPMMFTLHRINKEKAIVLCIDQHTEPAIVEMQEEVSLSEIGAQLHSISLRALNACLHNGWSSEDVSSLHQKLSEHEKMLGTLEAG